MTLLRLKYKNAPFSLLIKKVKKENVIKGVGIFWNAMEWKIDGVGIPRGGGEGGGGGSKEWENQYVYLVGTFFLLKKKKKNKGVR